MSNQPTGVIHTEALEWHRVIPSKEEGDTSTGLPAGWCIRTSLFTFCCCYGIPVHPPCNLRISSLSFVKGKNMAEVPSQPFAAQFGQFKGKANICSRPLATWNIFFSGPRPWLLYDFWHLCMRWDFLFATYCNILRRKWDDLLISPYNEISVLSAYYFFLLYRPTSTFLHLNFKSSNAVFYRQ